MRQSLQEYAGGGSAYRAADRNVWWPAGSRGAFIALALALASVLGVTTLALGLASRHLEYPVTNGVLRAALVVAPILAGLAWKLRRPDSVFGLLLIGLGVVSWTQGWQAANQPLLYSLGVIIGDAGVVLATFYLALAFPVGRLSATGDRIVMALIALAVTARVVWAFQTPVLQGGGTLSRCGDACPANPLYLPGPAWLGTLAFAVETIAIIAATVLFIGVFVHRLASAPRPRRRALLTVGLTSLVFFPMFLVYQVSRRLLELDAVPLEVISWTQTGLRVIFPIGFAVALVQADMFAGRALHRLLERLTYGPSPMQWRNTVAEALDDPTLRIGYWDPQQSRYREASGDELDVAPRAGSAIVTVDHHGVPAAAIEVDAILRTDPELLRAAANATLLAVERGILQDELRASQQAVLDAGEEARRRIAQDLHDSAQQRLVALRMHLEAAGAGLRRPEDREVMERLSVDVSDALSDIRAVAKGSHVDQLHREGLAAALRASIADGRSGARVEIGELPRLPRETLDAAYFVILEALQNVAKHAGSTASAVVRVRVDAGHLAFDVVDDGIGFDPDAARGLGIDNMADRMSAVGGMLTIRSAPGAGTTIAGRIPLAGWA